MTTTAPTRWRSPGPDRRGRPGAGRRRLGWSLVALGAVVLLLLAWGALSGFLLYRHASNAAQEAAGVEAALSQDDATGALRAARSASVETAAAHRSASAFPLVLASWVPGRLGRTVGSVRTVVGAGDLAVRQGALPLLRAAAGVQDPRQLLRADGSIDVEHLSRLAATARPAVAALQRARSQADGAPTSGLLPLAGGPLRQARSALAQVAQEAGTASAALSVLPGALGGDGPRSYLVAFQNPAELRPTGGIVGTWSLVRITDGRTSLVSTGSDGDLGALQGPLRSFGAQYAANYDPAQVRLAQDVNLSPHFPYAAQLLSDLWTSQGRPRPDGVIALDPEGLAPLLRGQGDIHVPGGPAVNADDVVDVLLSQAYAQFGADNDARKQYLATVVGTVFDHALGGGAFSAANLKGVLDAAEAGHVLAWSSRPGEEAALASSGLSGALPAPSPGTAGVYLTNTSASKLDYYLSEEVTTTPACGIGPGVMRIVLHNAAPPKVPTYVANKNPGVPGTTEQVLVALYLPPQRGVSRVTVGGLPVAFAAGAERGWSLARFDVEVPRTSDTAIDVDLTGDAAPLQAIHTQAMVHPAAITLGSCPG